ncbi:hypothetical protein BC940DRAFT_295633 [Gongronella butleri]|nr:hypothetical protein BC940DRAFT_295633 [Gongronella butleri]
MICGIHGAHGPFIQKAGPSLLVVHVLVGMFVSLFLLVNHKGHIVRFFYGFAWCIQIAGL